MAEEATPDVKQQRMREFLQLLPLTLEIAGLPKAPVERLFNSDQMEARVTNIRIAYKLGRQMLRDIGDNGI
ncbi:MAG: hypothetical protein ACRC7O_18050 [Fimbriiglobus sp.]